MKVVFLKNIKGVAQIGDIKDVSDGHARNLLFPKGMAKPALSDAIKEAGVLIKKREQGETLRKEVAQKLAQELQGTALEIKEDANDEGHLYGSVNEKVIVAALKEKGYGVKEEEVNLPEHIKKTGEHEVETELHPEVKFKLKVVVAANE
jgi:large subunit ribosomal protein L9